MANLKAGSTVGGYPILNWGNMGAGSGIDADLLDGHHGDYFVATVGDTMTGDLEIEKSKPQIFLNGVNSQYKLLWFQTGGLHRWYIGSNNASESGSDAGSNFEIRRYSDNGSTGSTVLSISRSSGAATFYGSLASRYSLYVGYNGHGDSNIYFYDDNSNTWRTMQWDDSANDWRVEDNSGNMQKLWHGGNDGPGSGLNADMTDGLHVHSGTNNEANKIVRTTSNGYCYFGWINTTSGNTTSTISDVYVNTGDGFIRKATKSEFKSQFGIPNYTISTAGPSGGSSGDIWFQV